MNFFKYFTKHKNTWIVIFLIFIIAYFMFTKNTYEAAGEEVSQTDINADPTTPGGTTNGGAASPQNPPATSIDSTVSTNPTSPSSLGPNMAVPITMPSTESDLNLTALITDTQNNINTVIPAQLKNAKMHLSSLLSLQQQLQTLTSVQQAINS